MKKNVLIGVLDIIGSTLKVTEVQTCKNKYATFYIINLWFWGPRLYIALNTSLTFHVTFRTILEVTILSISIHPDDKIGLERLSNLPKVT